MNNSSEVIIEKLNKALEADSDFPTRAQIITALKKATSNINTPIEEIVEILQSEPSLSSRLLHLTNSVYFGRGAEITTLTQAVNQLGLKGVYNLCANFVLLQKFSGLTEKNSAFSNCFLMSLLTSNIASFLESKGNSDKDEEGYLAGSLFSIGPLLLGFYFPKLFSEAEKRAERKRVGMFKAIEELLGIPAVEISIKIVQSLSVPEIYRELLAGSLTLYTQNLSLESQKNASQSSTAVCIASMISEIIISSHSPNEIEAEIKKLSEKTKFNYSEIQKYVSKLPSIIDHQKNLLNNSACSFPEPFVRYLKGDFSEEKSLIGEEDSLSPYLSQIETAIQESETLPSIIATVMEALSFACEFDRVIYLESDFEKISLKGKLGLGDGTENISNLLLSLKSKDDKGETIVSKAFHSSMVETFGKPLFENSWPYIAIPVGFDDRSLGVIYADRTQKNQENISSEKSIALTIISDLLDRAIQKSHL